MENWSQSPLCMVTFKNARVYPQLAYAFVTNDSLQIFEADMSRLQKTVGTIVVGNVQPMSHNAHPHSDDVSTTGMQERSSGFMYVATTGM